jgi:predicted Zn-dependent protease with MMP-like domain
MMRVGHRAFERLVADALDSLPDAILRMLDNVAVVVADEPTAHQLARMRLAANEVLLGLYEGIPLTERTSGYGAIEAECDTEDELVEAVRHTVVHELAHHLGISDARLIELGYEEDLYDMDEDER